MAKIPEEVLDVLGRCRVEEDTLFLPDVQLDRKLYVAVNKVLESMGGKWNRKAKGHVFESGKPAEMLEVVLLTHEVRDLKKEFQFFPTPKAIIVLHAFDLMNEGGILVSVVSESPFFRSDKKAVEFREFLEEHNAEVYKLDAGAFHESGTEILTRLVKIRK